MDLRPRTGSFNLPEDQIQNARIERARKMAEMLQAQSLAPIESAPSGRFIAPTSPFQGIAKILQAYVGSRGIDKADERQMQLANALRGRFDKAYSYIFDPNPQPGGITMPQEQSGITMPQKPGGITMPQAMPKDEAIDMPEVRPLPEKELPQAFTGDPLFRTQGIPKGAFPLNEDGSTPEDLPPHLQAPNPSVVMNLYGRDYLVPIESMTLAIPDVGVAPEAPEAAGIVAPKLPQEMSSKEFLQRVNIAARQNGLSVGQLLSENPLIGARYEELLRREQERDAELRALDKEKRDEERELKREKLKIRESGGQVFTADPEGGISFIGAIPNPNQPFNLGEGGAIVPNKAYQDYMLSKAAAGKPEMNVTVGAYEKKLSQQDAESVGKLRDIADSAYDNALQVRAIADILAPYSGGRLDQFKATLGQYMPEGTDLARMADANAVAESIRARLAPTMRVAGSGATSDFEMRTYLSALPSLINRREGRELMVKLAERMAERAAFRADMKDQLVRSGQFSSQKLNELMRERFGDTFLTKEERKALENFKNGKPQPIQQDPQQSGWRIERID